MRNPYKTDEHCSRLASVELLAVCKNEKKWELVGRVFS